MKGNVIKITLWDKTVGYLYWDKEDWRKESSVFQFDKNFITSGLDISPLRMPINSPWAQNGKSFRAGNPKGDFKGLPSVFADSLPGHWGNSIFRAWAQKVKIKMKTFTPVDYLSFIGTRGMGALEYHPSLIKGEDKPFDVNVNQLYEFAKSVLEDSKEITFNNDRELLWQDLIKLGTSPGGKRPKALIAINKTTNEIKSGQTTLPDGFDYYILKYDNEKDIFPYARLEYAYYKLCLDCGINIMPSELRRFENASHFITKRYDRVGGHKIHKLSLMAMIGDTRSYEEAFQTIRRLRLPYQSSEQLFRQMTFNILTGNIDDHARNFSFLMDENGIWSLSPAYDIVYSIEPDTLEFQKGQFMSVKGKFNEISARDIIDLGHENDINNPKETLTLTLDSLLKLPTYLKDLGVPESTYQLMLKELNKKYQYLNTEKTFILQPYENFISERDKKTLTQLGISETDIANLETTRHLMIDHHYTQLVHDYDKIIEPPVVNAIMEFSFHDGTVFVLKPKKKKEEIPLRQAIIKSEDIAQYSSRKDKKEKKSKNKGTEQYKGKHPKP